MLLISLLTLFHFLGFWKFIITYKKIFPPFNVFDPVRNGILRMRTTLSKFN